MYKNISVESVGTHRDIVTRTQDDIQGLISHILNLKQYMTSRYYVGILLFFFLLENLISSDGVGILIVIIRYYFHHCVHTQYA
jgi:hypothetical protein